MMKLPEDLRAYEHMMWLSTTQVVLEFGAWAGGSALWFRDRLRTLAAYGHIRDPKVISVDIDISNAARFLAAADPQFEDTITLIEGDVCDPTIAGKIRSLIEPNSSVMVVDDSAHTYESTSAVLGAYADLIQPGGFFVVEDVGVDIEGLRQDPGWPRGVLAALEEWLQSPDGQRFTVRRDLELYGVTNILRGFLQRSR